MPPKFIYFDLGNVLLHFSHPRMCQQIAALTGADEKKVWDFLFVRGDHEIRYESGALSSRDFYEALCADCGARPDFDRLAQAASDIFWLNTSIVPVLASLSDAGYRLGLLSNINDMHWQFIRRRGYGLIPSVFDVLALSYEIGAVKPDPAIFRRAAELAGVAPGEIFYTDDIAGHIAGARQAGFDAVQYTSTPPLVDALRTRGVKFNY